MTKLGARRRGRTQGTRPGKRSGAARSASGDADASDARGRALSIGALSRATRIPVETLRTWERRYGTPVPHRKPSGHRVYPAHVVEQLRRVERLLSQGHRPAEILPLSVRELDSLLELSAAPRSATAEPARPSSAAASPARVIEALMRATAELDRGAVLHELRTAWVRLGPLPCLDLVAGPWMDAVGRAWHEKQLAVRHEHFASACLSDFLRGVREPYDHQAHGPRVVAAMLPGDAHEGGLLMAAALLALRGYRVTYLGASTPLEQIVDAAKSVRADVVAVSVSAGPRRAQSAKAIAALRDHLPLRVPLWTGGAGAPRAQRGVERFASLSALDARLAASR